MSQELTGRKILILGAGTWQTPYIIKAKELGLQTYVTDWSNDPEGKQYAHSFAQIDLKDKEQTLAYARKNDIEAVFTAADIGVPTAAYVAEELSLPYHSQSLAKEATNKYFMRKKAKDIGLSVPRFVLVKSLDEAVSNAVKIGFPLIIKPIDNFSSRGVRVLNNTDELKEHFLESINASFSKEVLLEELMIDTEASVEVIVQNGQPIILGVCDKVKSPLPYRFDLQLNYPGSFLKEQYELIHQFIKLLVKGFGIKQGIIHVEVMVDKNSVKLIEFALRGCGTKIVTHLLPEMLNFNVMEYLIYSAFGIQKNINVQNKYSGILKFLMLENKKIKTISGLDDVLNSKGIIDFKIERKVGEHVGEVKDGRSRPGYVLAVGSDNAEATKLIQNALSKLRIDYFLARG